MSSVSNLSVSPQIPPSSESKKKKFQRSTNNTADLTWMTRMFSPVSCASCSRMCRVGFGVATKAAFNVSSCLALMVVRGPRLLAPEFCSSFSILFVSLSEDVELSVSFMSSCIGSCRSGDKLLSVHDDTGGRGGWVGGQTRRKVRSRSEMSRWGVAGCGGWWWGAVNQPWRCTQALLTITHPKLDLMVNEMRFYAPR